MAWCAYDEEVKQWFLHGDLRSGSVQVLSRPALSMVLSCLLLGGCRSASPVADAPGPERHFVRGKVMGVDKGLGTVSLANEDIPGFMSAMTMEYKVADPAVLGEVQRGDRITADLLNDKGADGPTNLRLANVDVIAQARPDAAPAEPYHVPAVGDAVPDFTLLNQSAKRISLEQFKGKVLLLTFVYTRCPLPDYCIRMSRNFAEIDKKLEGDPALYAKTHLLTVSFDPAHDTPAVLRSYGGAYTGRYSQETFGHWDFAVPSVAELPKMEHWFDVGVTPTPVSVSGGGPVAPSAGALQHSLATLIVGADGKVLAFYPTNDWTVDEALKVVRGAVS